MIVLFMNMYNDDDDLLFSNNVDPDIELDGGGITVFDLRKGKSRRTSVRGNSTVEDTVEVEIGEDDTKNGMILSDDLFSLDGSNSDEVDQSKKKWLEFNVGDMDNPIFCLGMLFANKKQLKDVVKNVNIKDMVNIMFKKNDKIRLKVVCHCGCEWTLYGRKLNKNPNDPTFKIKIFKSKHTC